MLQVKDIFDFLKSNHVRCFCGVPDSLLKDFCAYITDNTSPREHIITANEGNAIALAAGHYLATRQPALVYMQNSGLGNCVNPLLSLTDNEVYAIPLLMFIGWRGEPGTQDEPQHTKQGKVTNKLLEAMEIDYAILPDTFEEAKQALQKALLYMKETNKPYAFMIRKNTFEKYNLIHTTSNPYTLHRAEAIETVIQHLTEKDILVSSTGHISREVYEARNKFHQSHKQDFLTVGSMGHASSLALGIALEKTGRTIYCFDGDGAFLMHQGAVGTNASKHLKNFKHIVFNNEAHDSVGGQPTAAHDSVNLSQTALAAGYEVAYSVDNRKDLLETLPLFINTSQSALLEIKVKCGAKKDLGRPKEKPVENKKIFMENLNQIEFCSRGAIENLPLVLRLEKSKKGLVFTGKKSYQTIRPLIEDKLNNFEFNYYSDFSTNPKQEEIETALQKIKYDFDIIIAIGGGSVIDFAKGFRYYSSKRAKLIAIPTTAGTGSEATQFAVVYNNGIKQSLDDVSILPEYAIVDSQFVESNPRYLKACTALDAFCHCVESLWSIQSTPLSRFYAQQAMILCHKNILPYVLSTDIEPAKNIMRAANLSGKAINISKTTAAHALSYVLTSQYGLPHGHAVALLMPDIFRANNRIDSTNCTDPRGMTFVKSRLQEIATILDTDNVAQYWSHLMQQLGLEHQLDKLGIVDKKMLIYNVNEERLKNNPVNIKNYLERSW